VGTFFETLNTVYYPSYQSTATLSYCTCCCSTYLGLSANDGIQQFLNSLIHSIKSMYYYHWWGNKHQYLQESPQRRLTIWSCFSASSSSDARLVPTTKTAGLRRPTAAAFDAPDAVADPPAEYDAVNAWTQFSQ